MLRFQREESELEVRAGLTGLLSHDDRSIPSVLLREQGLDLPEGSGCFWPKVLSHVRQIS